MKCKKYLALLTLLICFSLFLFPGISKADLHPTYCTINNIMYAVHFDVREATVRGLEKTNVTSVSIPSTIKVRGVQCKVVAIGYDAFKNNTSLTSISIGDNVKVIRDAAFAGCTKLAKVSGGKNLIAIYKEAFKKCTSLKSFTLHKSVYSIGAKAFMGCKALETITVKTTMLVDKSHVGTSAFAGINEKVTIKCPKKYVKEYKKAWRKKGISKKATFE